MEGIWTDKLMHGHMVKNSRKMVTEFFVSNLMSLPIQDDLFKTEICFKEQRITYVIQTMFCLIKKPKSGLIHFNQNLSINVLILDTFIN